MLRAGERKRMADADAPLVLSAASVWELRLKWHSFRVSGGRKGPLDPAAVVAFANAMGWELLPLAARHATAALTPPLTHRDPFDEILLVQAQEDGMRLLTRDSRLVGHPFSVSGSTD